MKAKVIKTGEIVDVIPELGGWCVTDFKSYSHHYEDKELDFEFQDWEKFRREAAKDILCAVLAGGIANGAKGFDAQKEELVNVSIGVADELIAKLKEK